MKDAIALTDFQLGLVRRAAAALPVEQRADYLQGVAVLLAGQPTNDAVMAAINAVLDRNCLWLVADDG
jgi:hypothetical protein